MMKLNIFYFLGLLIFATGCSDFLEEEAFDFVSESDFYQSEEDAEAAVNAVYQKLPEFGALYGVNYYYVTEMASEVASTRQNAQSTNPRGSLDVFNFDATHPYFRLGYVRMYEIINRANSVVENVGAMTTIDATFRDRVVGEARFLRALMYFNLVRMFGEVPLRTEATDNLELALEQTPGSEVPAIYQAIIDDLSFAASALPYTSAYQGDDIGRANRGAAQGLLAKVYAHKAVQTNTGDADYQQAAEWASMLMNSGEHQLVPSVSDLWNFRDILPTENTAESLFELQLIGVNALGNRLNPHMAPRQSGFGPSQWSSFQSELPFYNSYAEGDERRAVTFVESYTNANNGELAVYNQDSIAADGYSMETPSFAKHLDPLQPTNTAGEKNQILLRYADILLTFAEARNELDQGLSGDGLEALNRVRRRAFGFDAGTPSEEVDYPDLGFQEAREAIYNERRWELAIEGHSWFDGVRFFDIFEQRVEASSRTAKPEGLQHGIPKLEIDLTDKHRLFPIPELVLERNTSLDQNTGY